MGDAELLDMLATETDRRRKTLIKGVEKLAKSGKSDPGKVEELRVDAHGIKGAAMVVGQDRLAKLALKIEEALKASTDSGQIDSGLAAAIVGAVNALHEGARAAAEGADEPPSVEAALKGLG